MPRSRAINLSFTTFAIALGFLIAAVFGDSVSDPFHDDGSAVVVVGLAVAWWRFASRSASSS